MEVAKRFDVEYRVEEMGETDALSLGNPSKEGAVPIEAPWPPLLLDGFDVRLVMAIE